MKKLSKREFIESVRKLKGETVLWLVILYEGLLLVPALVKGVKGSGNDAVYFGYHYLEFFLILALGTILFYFVTLYILEGNQKIVLYSSILLTWGVFMELLLLFPGDDDLNSGFIIRNIILLLAAYVSAVLAGVLFIKIRKFRQDSVSFLLACLSVLFYILLMLFGVGPGGQANPEARTNLPFPVVGSIPVTEILKVIFLMVLVCLLCKQARSKEEKRKRLMLSALYTGINMLGMLAINEMGSLLIVLLVYIAFIVIYMQEIKYSIAVIAAGVLIVLSGVMAGEMMTDSINKKISAKELISCFYDREVPSTSGYHGGSGTIEDFRPALTDYFDGKSRGNDRKVTETELKKIVGNAQEDALSEAEEQAVEALFSDKTEIGYGDMKAAVEDRKNQSMMIAMSYLFADQGDKEDFLGTYYFTKIYNYYVNYGDTNALERFYVPKYGKVKTRFYCWTHPEWDNGDSGYQNYRARAGVRDGGLFGKDSAEISTVPNADSDMIFVAISEMFGNICPVLLLLLFFMLFWEGKKIVLSTKHEYNSGMAFGISFMIWIQAVFMTASNYGLFPIFGMPIPFISNGGASKCVTMAMIGIMVVMSAVEMEEDAVEDERTKNRMVILSRYYVTEPLKHLGKAVWAFICQKAGELKKAAVVKIRKKLREKRNGNTRRRKR
ncbi:MAG TPA: FtsW/RodA/SpoVE family cell cycle protein [Candidatus Anaerostipes avistercoris]|uniref:Probable peptidoglycan glycosyltransferase FtsW n=1 Tax=Candidatus Anaerostipes avistercoris TaxID=2838462 RepID=A0A9D2TAA8_9FIRM|nr:FtsW/RodA/SpoVE family cell cycle protein [Candidatus Anaerostipes avistercoris]